MYLPREESFPFPLKYIDVSRTTHANLDVKQENRIDDYWNIDGSRDLSDPWTGFTQFSLLGRKTSRRFLWSGWRLTRKQFTSRPDHLWPGLWISMGKHAKLKQKQMWSNEKLHLENARKLRGIYFIDPEDTEFKETIKNAREKLETSVAPALPCTIMKNCGSDGSNKVQTKLACVLEDDECTRMRVGNSMLHYHQDHIAGKGENSVQHYNWQRIKLVYSVTMHVHTRARCDAHHTMHVALTYTCTLRGHFLAKAAFFFFFMSRQLVVPSSLRKMAGWEEENGYRCTYGR